MDITIKDIIKEYGDTEMMILGGHTRGFDYLEVITEGSLAGKTLVTSYWANEDLDDDEDFAFKKPVKDILTGLNDTDVFIDIDDNDNIIIKYGEYYSSVRNSSSIVSPA